MKKNILSILILILIISLGCKKKEEGPNEEDEKAAALLYKNANILWISGDEVNAIKDYKKLATEYPDTKAKQKAEKRLEKEGISIGKPMMSWTILRMVEMENELAENLFSGSQYNSDFTFSTPLDAWGNKIFFKAYSGNKAYDFIVFSNGPDLKKGTDDDLAVVHFKEKREAQTSNLDYGYNEEESDSLSSYPPTDDLLRGSSNNNSRNNDAETTSNGTVSLEELKGMYDLFDSDNDSNDETISLDQLKEEAEKSTFDEDSEDMELSLDEFKEFAK